MRAPVQPKRNRLPLATRSFSATYYADATPTSTGNDNDWELKSEEAEKAAKEAENGGSGASSGLGPALGPPCCSSPTSTSIAR